MHTAPAAVTALQGILGCQVGSFPQTYLGLPLWDTKLRLSPFAPLISMDRYLGGWPNPMGWGGFGEHCPRQQTGMERIGYTGRDAYWPGKRLPGKRARWRDQGVTTRLGRHRGGKQMLVVEDVAWVAQPRRLRVGTQHDVMIVGWHLARRKQKFWRNALLHVNLKKTT
jgi:hypothetical protein